MNNTATLQTFASTDSTGRVFDPDGQNFNYFNNMQGNVYIGGLFYTGINFSFNAADFGLAVGDTLWIGYSNFPACKTGNELMLTNTSVIPADFNLTGATSMYIVFRSNADGLDSKGFDITWKKNYKSNQPAKQSPGGYGTALVFNSEDGSFQAGTPTAKIGIGAGCIGCQNAKGAYSFAASRSFSLGRSSAAFSNASAVGDFSFAAGTDAYCNGRYSYALGRDVTAQADFSTAIGWGTKAKSSGSTAIGIYNDTLTGTSATAWVDTYPLVYIGNGRQFSNRSNAMVIYKNANVDINGYTRLGKASEAAPKIKMKKIIIPAGPAVNALANYPFGRALPMPKVSVLKR